MSSARFRRCLGGVSSLGLHVVWCPKYRRRLLVGRVAARLHELADEIACDNASEIVAEEAMPDQAEVARRFEGRTSRVARAEFAA